MPRNQPPQTDAAKANRFKKGNQAGKGHGRPRKLPNLDRLLLEVLGTDDDENSGLKQILEGMKKRAISGDKPAADLLIDRAYGKQQVDKPIVIDNKLEIKISYE